MDLPESLSARTSYLLGRAAARLHALGLSDLEPLGITPREYSVLAVVAESSPLSQTSVAEILGLDRTTIFVTNAVKHFKFEPRGKRRIHKKPNAYEIDRCRWWLDHERSIVRPQLIVALGGSAARTLFERPVVIAKTRGNVVEREDGTRLLVTIHPSYLLRIQDARSKAAEYRRFVADLRVCAETLAKAA